MSASLKQDPIGHLRRIGGSLAQDVCVKTSSAGSCRSTCARSLAQEDLGTNILTERSWTRDRHTEIWHKEVQDPDETQRSTEILHK